ncbi:hypothetical protein BDF14DRAFT_1544691 [Spinellus fusiger]|nr:hypothetical protein BDF14DRAFT_1544691 [Spinellus fusiger]
MPRTISHAIHFEWANESLSPHLPGNDTSQYKVVEYLPKSLPSVTPTSPQQEARKANRCKSHSTSTLRDLSLYSSGLCENKEQENKSMKNEVDTLISRSCRADVYDMSPYENIDILTEKVLAYLYSKGLDKSGWISIEFLLLKKQKNRLEVKKNQ